jgi:hypothetical protein
VPRPSSPVHAKASTNCPYLTLESPHHQRQRWARSIGSHQLGRATLPRHLVWMINLSQICIGAGAELHEQLALLASPKADTVTASILRTHSQCQRGPSRPNTDAQRAGSRVFIDGKRWWSLSGSNRRPQACKASALPTELRPRRRRHGFAAAPHACRSGHVVGREGVEPSTSRLSGVRSNHLSYRPTCPPSPTRRAARGVSQLRLPPRRAVSVDEGT